MQHAEQLPRIFQANAHRLIERVLAPVAHGLPLHESLTTGIATTMDEFLERCAAQVDNYTANETYKVFALVQVALFERQLRLWAGLILDETSVKTLTIPFLKLVDLMAEKASIDLASQSMREIIEEAFEVGNAVRHGEGRALERIKAVAPRLIDRTMSAYIDLLPPSPPDSEWLCLRTSDLKRHARAIIRFWGLADRLPGAVSEIPFSIS